jgi:hypothetical protein
MRLPTKPSQTPTTAGTFAILRATATAGGQRIRRGLCRAHDLAQLHDIGRREEVHAEHVLRTSCHLGDLVDVEIRGVAGEHRARLCKLVECCEHLFLDRHGLEHRLDDEIRVLDVLEADHAVDQAHAFGGRVGRECRRAPRSPRNSSASRPCRA